MKKRRGAADEEERREVGEVLVLVVEAEVSVSREVVGSRWFCRWSRFDSINRKD